MLFLGRQHELRHLTEACAAATRGLGGVQLLVGEPGIGKTRLAEEAATLAQRRGMTVAWGRAWETGGAPPFYPWLEVLEALGGSQAGAPSLDESRMARGESASSDAAHERFALFDRVAKFLRARSRTAPLLLVFDDLHAADVPSLELLWFVSRNLRSRQIGVIGTLRDVEAKRAPVAEPLARVAREATILALGALGSEHVAQLVEERIGHADARLTADLLARTEGNPLLVVESLRALHQASAATHPSVLALVASRIEGLDAQTSELLDAASVFGRRPLVVALARATDMPVVEVVRRLGDLAARGVLRSIDDGSFVFSHALVREAFYERIAPDRRRELHRAIAVTLTSYGARHAALAAHHWLAAVPLVSAQDVIRAAIVAAEGARAQLAPEDAVTLLEQASLAVAELAVSEPDRIELLLALGWAATEAGSLARGRQVFREASRRALSSGDATLVARAALGQGAELVFGEVRDELVATLRSALEDLAGPPELRARLLARLAAALQPSTTPDEPVALAASAMQMAKAVADPRVRAEIALAAGSALTDFAPPSARIPVSDELVRSARSLDDAVLELRGLTRLATDWLELGDFARAEGVIDARAELAARIGHPRHLWQTPLLRSMLAMPGGAFALCDEAIEEATAIGQEGCDVNATNVIARHRFWLLLLRGDLEGLRAHTPEMLRALVHMPEPAQHHALVRALVHARSGDAPAARQSLAGIGDGLRMLAPMMLATIADCALLSDDAERFADLLARLEPARGRNTAWGPFAFVCGPPYEATLGSLAARLDQREEALAAFAGALELAQRAGARANEAWVRLARAEALRRWSLPAADDFERAAGLASELKMPAILARAGAGPAAAVVERFAPSAPQPLDFSFSRAGKELVLTCRGKATRLKPLRGLTMLAQLVEQPGREVHVLDLTSEPEEGAAIDGGDAGEVLDAKAREAYQRRIAELRAELDDAERCADPLRAERGRRELDLLVQQLSSAVGLGGRARRVGAAAERARTAVQRRIREAIKKLAEHEPELGRHLDWAIRTGTYCAYEPLGRNTAR